MKVLIFNLLIQENNNRQGFAIEKVGTFNYGQENPGLFSAIELNKIKCRIKRLLIVKASIWESQCQW